MSEFSSKRHSVRSNSVSSRNSLSPGKESTAGRKRESRPRTRKVTSLTAEQLERKRANDREAQRTIRQRTKEHIEQLERQVAELSVRGEQMDGLLQRNAVLEREISYLRQQLAAIGSGGLDSVHGKAWCPLSPLGVAYSHLLHYIFGQLLMCMVILACRWDSQIANALNWSQHDTTSE